MRTGASLTLLALLLVSPSMISCQSVEESEGTTGLMTGKAREGTAHGYEPIVVLPVETPSPSPEGTAALTPASDESSVDLTVELSNKIVGDDSRPLTVELRIYQWINGKLQEMELKDNTGKIKSKGKHESKGRFTNSKPTPSGKPGLKDTIVFKGAKGNELVFVAWLSPEGLDDHELTEYMAGRKDRPMIKRIKLDSQNLTK